MVEDAETLYRRIKYEWVGHDQGEMRLSSQAFSDRGLKPSVNRAAIWPDPADAKFDESDGVAQLVVVEVRAIDSVIQNPQAQPDQQIPYRIDVLARPIPPPEGEPPNPSHAQVESAPDLANRTRFDKVKDALARLAERRQLLIQPQPPT